MRIFLKIVLLLVVVAAVAGAAGVGYLYTKYPDVPPAENITVVATPEKVARGEYLAKHVTGCVECHAERDFTKYAGPMKPETLGMGGEEFGDPETAIRVLSARTSLRRGLAPGPTAN